MQTDTPRVHAPSEELVPRALARGIFALIVTVFALVSLAVITDRPLEAVPADTPILAERMITLSTDRSGATKIHDASGALIADLASNEAGFISGLAKVLERERQKHRGDLSAPIALRLRDGNRLSLFDPVSGWSAELTSYGADNIRTFARLLEPTATAEGSL